MSKNKLVKAAGLVMIVSLISKIIGFLRDALIASSFGATYRTDAYLMSLQIPNILFGIFGMAITTTFIPILSESYSKKGKEDMYEFANSIMNLLLIISFTLIIIGWVFTPEIVRIMASKFTGRTYDLTVYLTKLSVINILFLSMVSGFTAILQTMDEFTAPALVGVIMNIPIIGYIMFGNRYGIEGLTVATMVGNGLQIAVQLPWLIKNKYRYKFKINFKDERIKKMLFLIAPVIIGTGVNQINQLVQNNMASGLPEGSIAALDYANKLNGLIYFTFASAIVTVIYPSLSREGSSKNYDSFKAYMTTAVNNMNLILMPCAVGLLILRVPIISVLFMHGAFDQRAVDMTSLALFYLVAGIVFWGIRDVFNRAFYSIQDTRTPMINGVLGVVINIIFSIILVRFMGIGGLTLSTTISALFSCVLLVIDLRKKIGSINGMEMFTASLKILAASIVMGVTIYFTDNLLRFRLNGLKGDILIIFICMLVAVLVYSVMLIILRVKEIKSLADMVATKLRKQSN